MKELKLLQEIENQIDIDDAWKAKNEPGEPIPWEELKKELELWVKPFLQDSSMRSVHAPLCYPDM